MSPEIAVETSEHPVGVMGPTDPVSSANARDAEAAMGILSEEAKLARFGGRS